MTALLVLAKARGILEAVEEELNKIADYCRHEELFLP
jgi:hypothetical protein